MKVTCTHQLALSTESTPVRVLKDMLAQVPDDATVSLAVEHIPADRSWESARTNVKVFAEWVTEL